MPSDATTSAAVSQVVAARIAELAQNHGMKVSSSADVATLLAAIKVGDPIPIAAFAVVADVLFAILNANLPQQERQEARP